MLESAERRARGEGVGRDQVATIRVGAEHQAMLPEPSAAAAAPAPAACEQVWSPRGAAADDDVAKFVQRAKRETPAADDATILEAYLASGYDATAALAALASAAPKAPWTPGDAAAFERAVAEHGDDVAKLCAAMGHKPRREVVSRYFRSVHAVGEDKDVDDKAAGAAGDARRAAADAALFLGELHASLGARQYREVLLALRRFDQGLLSAAHVDAAVGPLLDDDLHAAFRSFLPAGVGDDDDDDDI